MKSEMRDADMPLLERIERAIDRITSGSATMRVPVEATDPDIVLRDAANRVARLEEAFRKIVDWYWGCVPKKLEQEARAALGEAGGER